MNDWKQHEAQSEARYLCIPNAPRLPRAVIFSPNSTLFRRKCGAWPEHHEHSLLTDKMRRQLPGLYATENDDNPVVQVRLTAWGHCDWNIIEFDGDDIFFGFVWVGVPVWGYFRLSDLDTINSWHGNTAIVVDPRYDEPRHVTSAMMDYLHDE